MEEFYDHWSSVTGILSQEGIGQASLLQYIKNLILTYQLSLLIRDISFFPFVIHRLYLLVTAQVGLAKLVK
jgi:hypothetical protein